jgi:hypothetical protein
MKRAKNVSSGLPDDPVVKELVRIRNLMMLGLLAQGFRSEDVDLAVKMGPANIRRALPIRRLKRAPKNGV